MRPAWGWRLVAFGCWALVAPTVAFTDGLNATYDALNRLSTVSYCDGSGVSYAYDASGNRTGVTAAAPTRTITLTVPNGGENWTAGSSQLVTWTSVGGDPTVDILLSRDNGSTWEVLAVATPNDGSEVWTVTGPLASQARIRVRGTSCRAAQDAGDLAFSISSTVALSIGDAAVVEGNSGTTTATLTVTLSPPSGLTTTVAYTTADGTATAGSDYVATSGTLTFAPGVTTQSISVPVIGDGVYEGTETLVVTLSNPVNAILARTQGTGTIANDEPTPSLSVNDVSMGEGNSGTTTWIFSVALSGQSAFTTTVNYGTANGSATAGVDFVATSGTLTFSPGVTTQTIAVGVIGDDVYESAETFYVNFTNPTNAVTARPQASGNIINDDAMPSLSVADVTVAEGNSGTTPAVFVVALSAPSSLTTTVAWSTADGTAIAGSDYTTQSGTLTFAPGVVSQTIAVPVSGDSLYESNETLFVNLSSPAAAFLARPQGTGTITNDDAIPSLSIANLSVTEGNSGAALATFTVTLSAPSALTTTAAWATANGTATAGSDYAPTSGTLTIAAGLTSQTVTVPVNGDGVYEPDETFFVDLSIPANATIAQSRGTGTIANDEPVPSLSIGDVSVPEGDTGTTPANFSVTLSGPSAFTTTVAYATADVTAVAGSDYALTSGTLTFNPGVTTQTITVPVNGDGVYENDEAFAVSLSGPANAVLGRAQGTGTIANDEAVPTLSIGDVTLAEGNSGTTPATFTVTLSGASALVTTVAWATADGTATAGEDYVQSSGTVTLNAGVTSQTIVVAVNGDTAYESDESFLVNLSVPANATIARSRATGAITNDDAEPTLSIDDVQVAEGGTGTTPATFTVTLSAPSKLTTTVSYATANVTATAGSDYLATSGTLTFGSEVTTQTIAVSVISDVVSEPTETFRVILSAPANATIARAQGTGTIRNDDFTLTVVKAGAGSGTVTSDLPGIACGVQCTNDYPETTVLSLTATPDSGSRLTGWSGACTGTGTCVVTIDTAVSVTASFAPLWQLTVTKSGAGSGTVTSSPAGIDCGATCSEEFVAGTLVTLTAVADAGSAFDGWTGACSGTSTCTVTLDADASVSAAFKMLGGFHTVTPCRVFDSRAPSLGGPDPLLAGSDNTIPVANKCGVAPEAKAVVLNVTVVSPTSGGHLRVYPGGETRPLASTLNFAVGQTRGNNAILPLGAGSLAVYLGIPNGSAHVVVDVAGYFVE
jgi:large repetitive protein